MPRLVSCLILFLTLWALPALAQDVRINFGQSLRLDGAALDVSADSLIVNATTGATEFSGNVVAIQGDMRISAESLRLEYAPNGATGSQRIQRVVASGGVVMATSSEAIEAREAVYSLDVQRLEMSGDVLLVQGANMLAGQRFVADLRNGTGTMQGRVRTVIRLE